MHSYGDLDKLDAGDGFLVRAWREQFDPFTCDTFQPRLHNSASLVEELEDLVSRGDERSRWWGHVGKVRDELSAVVTEEADALGSLPEYRWNVQRLLGLKSAASVRHACAVVRAARPAYEQRIAEMARGAFFGLPKSKQSSHLALRRLATLAMQRSCPEVETFPVNQPIEDGKVADAIIRSVQAGSEEYEVVFVVAGDAKRMQQVVRKVDFDLAKSSRLPAEEVRSLTEQHPQIRFVRRSLRAGSPRQAINESRRHLGRAVDLCNLYHNEAELQVLDEVFWRYSGGTYCLQRQSEQAFRRLYPRRQAVRDTHGSLDLVSEARMDPRLLSALELHSSALAVSERQLKLINLWSSLECLSGCCEGNTVTGRVLHLLVDLLVWRRIEKVVGYLAIGCKNLAERVGSEDFGAGFSPRSSKHHVDRGEMFRALCAPHDSGPIVELLRFASADPLLCFRIWRIWHEFHRPKRLREKLIRSRRRIAWQIVRIYRARNLLVHHGYETPHLGPLLDNLQYYCSSALQRVTHGLKRDPSWGVRDVIESWTTKSQYLLESLDEAPSRLTAGGVFDWSSDGGPPLWTATEATPGQ